MFNFYPNREVPKFKSNPELQPLEVIEPLLKDGVVTNHVRKVPRSNKSLLAGAHYDPSIMSLRALLNLGVKLDFVYPDTLENDPTVIYNRINSMSNTITTRYAQLLSDSVEPSNS